MTAPRARPARLSLLHVVGHPDVAGPVPLRDVVPGAAPGAPKPWLPAVHRTVFVFDHDLRYLYVGGQLLPHLDRPRAQFVGRTLSDVYAGEALAVREPAYRRALAGEDVTFDAPLAGDRVLEMHLTPLVDRQERVVAALGFTVDVTQLRAGARDLHDAQEQFRLDFQNAGIGKALLDVHGTLLRVNPALCRLLRRDEEDLLGRGLRELTHPDDRAPQRERLESVLRGERDSVEVELRYRGAHRDVWVQVTYILVRLSDGSASHMIAQVVDITAERDQQAAIDAGHAFQAAVLSASPDIISVYDLDLRSTIWVSPSVTTLLGHDPDALVALGAALKDRVVHPDDAAAFEASHLAAATLPDGSAEQLRCRMRHRSGAYRWFSRRITPFLRDGSGRVTQLLAVCRDVDDVVAFQAKLEHAASHDDLTDLPNRTLVEARLDRALADADGEPHLAVLFCDLDGFKRINDVHGHQTGDRVLVHTAARLLDCVRPGDTVGRMGGDEFVVVLSCRPDEDAGQVAEELAHRINGVLVDAVTVAGADHVVSASTGVAVAGPTSTAQQLLREADTAMYEAKRRGRGTAVRYAPSLGRDALDLDLVERRLRAALDSDTVEVHYQPLVRPGTGRVAGVEALVRVPDGDGGHIDAGVAVRVAEQTGLIGRLGDRVLRAACAQAARWRSEPGHADLRLSVNLSAHELDRADVHRRVSSVLAEHGLPPAALVVEITETVLLQAGPGTVDGLERLRADGVGIAIDDFGTGYASLRYLASLPVTELKIDQSFTRGLPDDRTCATLVRATLRLAEDLGLSCVVEGIEDAEQLDGLALGADVLVQGYLYRRPRPAAEGLPPHLPGGRRPSQVAAAADGGARRT